MWKAKLNKNTSHIKKKSSDSQQRSLEDLGLTLLEGCSSMLDPWLAKRRISCFQMLQFARWFMKVKPFASFALWFCVFWTRSICTPSCRMIKEALLIWRWAKWKVRTNMVDLQLTMLSCHVWFVFLLHGNVDLNCLWRHPSPPPNTSWQSHRCLWWWKSHWLQCPKSSGSYPEKRNTFPPCDIMWYSWCLWKNCTTSDVWNFNPCKFRREELDAWTA